MREAGLGGINGWLCGDGARERIVQSHFVGGVAECETARRLSMATVAGRDARSLRSQPCFRKTPRRMHGKLTRMGWRQSPRALYALLIECPDASLDATLARRGR
jgi:hypothetical protein